MRIAFVSQPWNTLRPPVVGGSIALWTYEVARRLANQAEVWVFSPANRVRPPGSEPHQGVRYRWVNPGTDSLREAFAESLARLGPPTRPAFWRPSYHRGYAHRVAEGLEALKPDIIHIQNIAPFAPELRRACPSARIVLHMHCDWLHQLDRTLTARYLSAVDLVVGCSNHVARGAAGAFPGLAATVVGNGVDLDRFQPAEERGRDILFVGRLSPEKGLHDLCEAFNRVARREPSCRLVIAGPVEVAPREYLVDLSDDPLVADLKRFYPGDYLAQCQAMQEPAARARTAYLGRVANDALPAHYARAALVVNPSLSESFGMSLAEAMASARPTLNTRVGGMLDVVEDGRTGLMVPPAATEMLADSMLTLLADAPLRQRFGEAGRRRAEERFGWDRIATGLLAAYGRIGLREAAQ